VSKAVKALRQFRRKIRDGLVLKGYRVNRQERRAIAIALERFEAMAPRLQAAGADAMPPIDTFACGHCHRRLPPSGQCPCVDEAVEQAKGQTALDEWRDAMNGTQG